jgi:hypothetical protein
MANHQGARQLWQRVLLQALRDAASPRERLRSDEDVAQASAKSWLDDAGPDFRDVCHLAGFSPEIVADWWAAAKRDPDKMRAAERWFQDNHNRKPKEAQQC